jgi:hypothetical protein
LNDYIVSIGGVLPEVSEVSAQYGDTKVSVKLLHWIVEHMIGLQLEVGSAFAATRDAIVLRSIYVRSPGRPHCAQILPQQPQLTYGQPRAQSVNVHVADIYAKHVITRPLTRVWFYFSNVILLVK